MPESNSMRVCGFPGCGRPLECKGLCGSHYYHFKNGKPLVPIYANRRPKGTPPRIEYDERECPRKDLEGPCHIFRGSKNKNGYGNVGWKGKIVEVHVYIWERDVAPIAEGMMLDHQCQVRSCCNIKHLRTVTPKQNSLENSRSVAAVNAAKTHCLNGHAFDEANTYVTKKGNRQCRQCQNESSNRWYRSRAAKKKEMANV